MPGCAKGVHLGGRGGWGELWGCAGHGSVQGLRLGGAAQLLRRSRRQAVTPGTPTTGFGSKVAAPGLPGWGLSLPRPFSTTMSRPAERHPVAVLLVRGRFVGASRAPCTCLWSSNSCVRWAVRSLCQACSTQAWGCAALVLQRVAAPAAPERGSPAAATAPVSEAASEGGSRSSRMRCARNPPVSCLLTMLGGTALLMPALLQMWQHVQYCSRGRLGAAGRWCG